MVEQIDSGITGMKDLMKGAALPEQEYNIDGMFTVTLKRQIKTSEKILSLIKTDSSITIKELAERLNKSTRTVETNLQTLRTERKIERIGHDKGGYWQIND